MAVRGVSQGPAGSRNVPQGPAGFNCEQKGPTQTKQIHIKSFTLQFP